VLLISSASLLTLIPLRAKLMSTIIFKAASQTARNMLETIILNKTHLRLTWATLASYHPEATTTTTLKNRKIRHGLLPPLPTTT